MLDERAFIARVEAAGPDELALLLTRPTAEEERALRAHLGDERYQRLHALALRRSVRRGEEAPRGNVVVLHGIMGAELTATDRGGRNEQLWLKALKIVTGRLDRLRLADDGRTEFDARYDVRASGILKRYYGELLLSLTEGWNVRAFWYDWRKDLRLAAAELDAQLRGWFDEDAPVHLVAHSMGGLAARTFIKTHPEHWQAMRGRPGDWDAGLGGRLIMLGTPNHGSFSIPQAITGLLDTIGKLALVDLRHSLEELLAVFNSFVGTYQMLPSPLVSQDYLPLYQADTYGDLRVPQRLLDNARRQHDLLADVVDPERMLYIAGDRQPTLSGLSDVSQLRRREVYQSTLRGDGSVPHALGLLRAADGAPVDTYYIADNHGNLTSNPRVLAALDELLRTGQTESLSQSPVAERGTPAEEQSALEAAQRQLEQVNADDRELLENYTCRAGARSVAVTMVAAGTPDGTGQLPGDDVEAPVGGADDLMYAAGQAPPIQAAGPAPSGPAAGVQPPVVVPAPSHVSAEERKVEESITRHFLGGQESARRAAQLVVPFKAAVIELGVEFGRIDDIQTQQVLGRGGEAVDAISVGHYLGVRPQAAEKALDASISRALLQRPANNKRPLDDSDLLLTQYTERGTIQGELGQPFFLVDPRDTEPGATGPRLIAIAGMGVPGRFGVPELTVLARELCWSLGRMGRRHLATVLIGAGNGNLSVADAIGAWLRGAKHAITGSSEDDQRRLTRLTFVEFDPSKVVAIHDALLAEISRQDKGRLEIIYDRDRVEKQLDSLRQAALQRESEALEREWEARRQEQAARASPPAAPTVTMPALPVPAVPTRITVSLDRVTSTYRFGAITSSAAIPEREIPLDPALVMSANDELAAEWEPELQRERGRFLERLLIPEDLREQLSGDTPVVLLLDSTTARVHWEALAQSESGGAALTLADSETGPGPGDEPGYGFLGTSRGLTRQLRTTFAPPPEPPPPPRRVLRILIVADPAEDARLPGAEAEGAEVAELFEQFNQLYADATDNRVEVVRLFGPREATRTNVLRHLILHSYDAMHFAGHCIYDTANPVASGFVFTGGARLTANELRRIDRIPKFVFANCCESGLTPDRAELRSVDLAPTFAESFFARGVANFVCTAWPVDDAAAREFALTLYGGLLGIATRATGGRDGRGQADPRRYAPGPLRVMYDAMREARLAIAGTPNGIRTWGAYQHYGNPHFRFFNQAAFFNPAARRRQGEAAPAGRRRRDGSAAGSRPASATPRGDASDNGASRNGRAGGRAADSGQREQRSGGKSDGPTGSEARR